MDVSVSPEHPKAGQEVTAVFAVGNVGSVDNNYHKLLNGGGEIKWGDGEVTPIGAPGPLTLKHTYKQTGDYTINGRMGGEYKWNSQGGSCSYVCNASGTAQVHVD